MNHEFDTGELGVWFKGGKLGTFARFFEYCSSDSKPNQPCTTPDSVDSNQKIKIYVDPTECSLEIISKKDFVPFHPDMFDLLNTHLLKSYIKLVFDPFDVFFKDLTTHIKIKYFLSPFPPFFLVLSSFFSPFSISFPSSL